MCSVGISVPVMEEVKHYPVMYREVMQYLDVERCRVFVDCTVGMGSHAVKLLEAMPDNAILIGMDKDSESLKVCANRLASFKNRIILVRDDFANIGKVLKSLDITGVDAILFDLGLSMYQLNDPERGFSFLREGPLDMRMNRHAFLCACDLVSNLSEAELESIFRKFGEERYSRRVAKLIVEIRKKETISTTTQLSRIVMKAMPMKSRKYRIHPATRIFQALRIAVNRELESLSSGINTAISFLNPNGRVGVISFHSLEDRIVKHTFRDPSMKSILKILTKKPLVPSELEKRENSASRSAKFRVAQKI